MTGSGHAFFAWFDAAVKRVVFLVLGAVILVPYVGLAIWLVAVNVNSGPAFGLIGAVSFVVVAVAITPAFLPAMRTVERATARALLGSALPVRDDAGGASAIWRGAVYYFLHLAAGGVAAFAIIFAVPVFVVGVVGMIADDSALVGSSSGSLFPTVSPATATVLALAASVAGILLIVVVVIALPQIAAMLLGPSAAERASEAEERAARAAQRNRVARELHDSVGHALTITTLQASAARLKATEDPAGVAAALTSIETVGRTALEELDRVLSVLRDPDDRASGIALNDAAEHTLGELDALLVSSRAAGLTLTADVSGSMAAVPMDVSAACFRIVQEGLTNVLHHASAPRVELYIQNDGARVRLRMANPMTAAEQWQRSSHHAGGRGLVGLRERVLLVDGEMDAGARDGVWVLEATVPLPPSRRGSPR